MPFLSIEFASFFLIFFPLYWLLRFSVLAQNILLITVNALLLTYISPYFAYSVFAYALLMIAITTLMHNQEILFWRRLWLCIGLLSAVGILSFFKYADFFVHQLYRFGFQDITDIFMPLGLSYYVFQSIAYLYDLYRKKTKPLQWHELLLHLSFFITITAGPIIRANAFKSIAGNNPGITQQLRNRRSILSPALAVTVIIMGIAKVWLFSGHIAEFYVNPVFDNPMQYSTVSLLLAVYGYTLQLFFDFSGYSDLVFGLALLIGFQIPWNFKAPLYAVNIRSFWARWHISLSTWIRDYIYIPLGGSRKGFLRTQINLMIALLLSGLWHGGSWNFVIWGALHGFALIILNIKQIFFSGEPSEILWLDNTTKYLSIFLTFNFVCFTFVIFKLTDGSEIQNFFTAMVMTQAENSSHEWLSLIVLYGGLLCYPLWIQCTKQFLQLLKSLSIGYWFVVLIIVMQIIVYYAPSGIPEFIYGSF
ncbi:MAG: MBOAT family protein [Gammaproteobacteria bacterium]|nr:MBOAT family protein [Gammaproteobacteria bacterium]